MDSDTFVSSDAVTNGNTGASSNGNTNGAADGNCCANANHTRTATDARRC